VRARVNIALNRGISSDPCHYIHHPSLDVVYFSNEQGCSVTAYRLDRANGTLSSVQTTSTLPAGHRERTTCSQIHLTPSGRFLYVGNRAANGSSIAAFAVDPATGHPTVAFPPHKSRYVGAI
jgi:6-phosphogluconolactonase